MGSEISESLWSERRAAVWLGVPTSKLKTWADKGMIPHLKVGRLTHMYEPHELVIWVRSEAQKTQARLRLRRVDSPLKSCRVAG